jgi:hypothetical protein
MEEELTIVQKPSQFERYELDGLNLITLISNISFDPTIFPQLVGKSYDEVYDYVLENSNQGFNLWDDNIVATPI